MIIQKLTEEDWALYEVIRNPVWCGEFLEELNSEEEEFDFNYTIYQKEMLFDFSPQVSIVAGRAVGKTISIVGKIVWYALNNYFDTILFTVPNRAHLDPVFLGLQRAFRYSEFLKFWIGRNSVNSQQFIIKFLNNFVLICRIAGTSGTGMNVVGLHVPVILLDECVVGTQRIACPGYNKKADTLKIGDKVLAWDGVDIVTDVVSRIEKRERTEDVLEIGFSGGYIRVGQNHRIYTDGGYKLAKDLTPGESIYHFRNQKRGYLSDTEISYIIDSIQSGKQIKEIALALGHSWQGIHAKLFRLGISVRGLRDRSLTDKQKQIILGMALGDGSIHAYKQRASLQVSHSYKQKQYVNYLVKELNNIIHAKPRYYRNGGWGTFNYNFASLATTWLLEVYKKLYINGKKTITREFLDLLDEQSFAIWYMDDGSADGVLSTHGFSFEENEIIVKFLAERFGLDSEVLVDKSKPHLSYVRIKNPSSRLFPLLEPYIIEPMLYKIRKGEKPIELEPSLEQSSEVPTESLNQVEVDYVRTVNTRTKHLYSIEVEGNHNFFVNGILTKNSAYYPHGTWLELMQVMNDWQKGHQLVVSGVPDGRREKSVLYQCDISDSFSKHRISAYENPRFTKEAEERSIEQFGGKDSQEFIHMVCFPPETRIISEEGPKDIVDIEVGDIILTHSGSWKKVIKTFARQYDGTLLSLKVTGSGDRVRCTPEHPIYGINLQKVTWGENDPYSVWRGNSHKPFYPKFIKAENLERLDRVAFPKFGFRKDLPKYINLSEFGEVCPDGLLRKRSAARNGYTKIAGRGVNPLIPLNKDTLFLLGVYLAEGCAGISRGNCSISLHAKEKPVALRLKRTLQEYFNIRGHIRIKKNELHLEFTSRIFAEFVHKYVGSGAANKEIPSFLLGVKTSKLLPLLEGLFFGDGCYQFRYKKLRFSFCTVSKKLFDQIRFILGGLGIVATTSMAGPSEREILGRLCKTKTVYYLELSEDKILKLYNQESPDWNDFDSGETSLQIKDIQSENYSGLVYNLEVEDDNSYVVDSFAVHNCGEHGIPIFSLFDREHMRIEDYFSPVVKIYGAQVKTDPSKLARIIMNMPTPPKFSDMTIIGVDLGYTEPTAIVVLYRREGVWYLLFRLELHQITYDLQERFLNDLDVKYNFNYIGFDAGAGGQGKSLHHNLINKEEYKDKNFPERLLPVEFGGTVVVGFDDEGEELKERVKPFSASQFQQMVNSHAIAFSKRDMELITELERITYHKTTSGNVVYKAMTAGGSDRGADHNFSALLTFAMVIFEKLEGALKKTQKVKLYRHRWLVP